MMKVLVVFALLLRIVLGVPSSCVDGIRTAVTRFKFFDVYGDYYPNLCGGNSTTISMWAAAKVYCTPDEIVAGSEMLGSYCEEYGDTELVSYSEILPILTDAYIKNMQIVEFRDIDRTKTWNATVLISKPLWKSSVRTIISFNYATVLDINYGWSVYGFWGGLLLIGILHRLFTFIFHYRIERRSRDIENITTSSSLTEKSSIWRLIILGPYRWVNANLIIPTAFGSHHQRLLWWCNIPTRMEFITLFVYYSLVLILSVVSFDIFDTNLYYTVSILSWRYIADRTGYMSYANLPVVWMFSGRNNIFLWATGWSFSTFNIFHRHVARIATILAIVHSVAYTIIQYPRLAYSWTQLYWYMGVMATISMSFLLVFSSVFLRQKFYELFIIIHIVLSVLTIVGLFYHTATEDGEYNPYNGYLWPLVAIWVFDRSARLVRLVYCNIHVKLSNGVLHTTSTATYSEEADLIRLEVIPGSAFLTPKPNQHYFLYQPLKWRGWENHPFTLASWSTVDLNGTTPPIHQVQSLMKTEADVNIVPVNQEVFSSTSASLNTTSSTTCSRYKLLFYIRPSNGWTKRLRNECRKQPTGPINTRILLEGPYGETSALHHYENLLLICGGTGIAGALPYLEDYIARSSAKKTLTHSVTLLWTTKQSSMIRDIAARELAPVLARADIELLFHSTIRGESQAVVQSTREVLEKTAALNRADDLQVKYGRPDVKAKVLEVIKEVRGAGSKGGRIAVLVCGPAGMADEARSAVHQGLKDGNGGIDYLEETFGW